MEKYFIKRFIHRGILNNIISQFADCLRQNINGYLGITSLDIDSTTLEAYVQYIVDESCQGAGGTYQFVGICIPFESKEKLISPTTLPRTGMALVIK